MIECICIENKEGITDMIMILLISLILFIIGTVLGISYFNIETLGIYFVIVFFQVILLLKIKEIKDK